MMTKRDGTTRTNYTRVVMWAAAAVVAFGALAPNADAGLLRRVVRGAKRVAGKVESGVKSGASAVKNGATTAAGAVVGAAQGVGNAVKNAAVDAAARAKSIADSAERYAAQAGTAAANAAVSAYKAASSALRAGLDAVVDLASAAVAKALQPMTGLAARSSFTDDARLAARRVRRDGAQCSTFNLTSAVAGAMRTVMTVGALENLRKTLSKAVMKLSSRAQAMQLMRQEGISRRAQEILNARRSETLAHLIKRKAKAAIAGSAATAVFHAATFPLVYVGAAIACTGKGGDDHDACYDREFTDIAKHWLFEGLVATGLAPLDATIISPLALKLAVKVAAMIAGATGPVGLVAGPVVGATVALIAKIGVTVALSMLAKKLFFQTYEGGLWKEARGFFRSLQGDAAKFFRGESLVGHSSRPIGAN